jgi:hypothetical protein
MLIINFERLTRECLLHLREGHCRDETEIKWKWFFPSEKDGVFGGDISER